MIKGIKKDSGQRILTLALPIIAGMVSQNLFNLVDIAMVGVLGNTALAAVGLGGFTVFMCHALVTGMSSGVQAMSSRRKGAGEEAQMAAPLNAAIVVIMAIAPLASLILYWLTPIFFPMLSNDSKVVIDGIPYVQARIASMVFVGINMAFRGYLSAVDLPRLFMNTLLATHALNILLNYVLIFGKWGFPTLGVSGAGIASLIATAFGSLIYLYLGWHHARKNGFLKSWPSKSQLQTLSRLSLPFSIEQLFFGAGFTVLFWIIGQVGTAELAAANVLVYLMLIVIYPAIGLGITAGALAGQSLGKNDFPGAKAWGWDVAKIGVLMLGLLGIPMWLAPQWVLAIFIHDPTTIAIASGPLRLVGITIAFIESFGMTFMFALLGAGEAKKVMFISIMSMWCFYLPAAYVLGPIMGYGLMEIWLLHVFAYRGLLALSFTILWQRGKWGKVKV